jgi:hypothetical protein
MTLLSIVFSLFSQQYLLPAILLLRSRGLPVQVFGGLRRRDQRRQLGIAMPIKRYLH